MSNAAIRPSTAATTHTPPLRKMFAAAQPHCDYESIDTVSRLNADVVVYPPKIPTNTATLNSWDAKPVWRFQKYRKAIKKLPVAFTKNVPHGKSDVVKTPESRCRETLLTDPPTATNSTNHNWSASMNLTSSAGHIGLLRRIAPHHG